MTCIVAAVSKSGVITMGGDSAGVAGLDLTVRKDPKVFVKGPFVFGFTTSFRMGQIIQYSFDAPEHDPRHDVDTYLRTTWVNALRKALESGGFATKNNGVESAGTFLLGYNSRLFMVDSDYQIAESLLPYDAVGCGHAFAKGAMFATSGSKSSDRQRVTLALRCAESHSCGVRAPFLILEHKSK